MFYKNKIGTKVTFFLDMQVRSINNRHCFFKKSVMSSYVFSTEHQGNALIFSTNISNVSKMSFLGRHFYFDAPIKVYSVKTYLLWRNIPILYDHITYINESIRQISGIYVYGTRLSTAPYMLVYIFKKCVTVTYIFSQSTIVGLN